MYVCMYVTLHTRFLESILRSTACHLSQQTLFCYRTVDDTDSNMNRVFEFQIISSFVQINVCRILDVTVMHCPPTRRADDMRGRRDVGPKNWTVYVGSYVYCHN